MLKRLLPDSRAVTGAVLIALGAAFMLVNIYIGLTYEKLQGEPLDQAVFGVFCGLLPGLFLGGPMILTSWRRERNNYRDLLAIVAARGSIALDELARELRRPVAQVRELIYQAVHDRQFSGYIDWHAGVVYSAEAQRLNDLKRCPNCGGTIALRGKGVAQCEHCGTQIFIGTA